MPDASPTPVRRREELDPRPSSRDRSWPPAPGPLPLPVIDNHCHLDFADGDEELTVTGHVERAAQVGIDGVITIGSDMEAARWTARLMADPARPAALRGGVAVHPNEAALHARGHGHDGEPMIPLDEAIAEISQLIRTDGMVTVGETGLDWFRTSRKDEQARDAQFEAFRAHIALAKETGLPMQIHDREAHRDVLEVLDADGAPDRTVLHCFSGDAEFARACVDRGFYLSFAGNVTFKNAENLRGALAEVGIDRVMVETDAPFLTPVPYRGRPNSSYLVPLTMAQIAESAGVDLDEACRRVGETTREVYGWPAA
ncbi:TatD family hydrolase [Brachybacterium muris]|uniref:TatD family hydrolase n=1 Tax=Brachybacterium muris TaxID=219301 RepID=UPI00034BA2D7|nr:TatD family hydrolase [Brachybacterium muris]MCT1654197.1 TatD family hydrolase [Brachybacterium muris]MCT1997658.1 TatD family hydrolase [Brachybacterium muris]MCT2177151.1 TatD family hydrolase [Brachybacterium muris]MCT2260613.1 TatD family hydrolase [Brachybacterium muris]MCT2295725.1 TatD family hydrolase [Brachybacterium muris]